MVGVKPVCRLAKYHLTDVNKTHRTYSLDINLQLIKLRSQHRLRSLPQLIKPSLHKIIITLNFTDVGLKFGLVVDESFTEHY